MAWVWPLPTYIRFYFPVAGKTGCSKISSYMSCHFHNTINKSVGKITSVSHNQLFLHYNPCMKFHNAHECIWPYLVCGCVTCHFTLELWSCHCYRRVIVIVIIHLIFSNVMVNCPFNFSNEVYFVRLFKIFFIVVCIIDLYRFLLCSLIVLFVWIVKLSSSNELNVILSYAFRFHAVVVINYFTSLPSWSWSWFKRKFWYLPIPLTWVIEWNYFWKRYTDSFWCMH